MKKLALLLLLASCARPAQDGRGAVSWPALDAGFTVTGSIGTKGDAGISGNMSVGGVLTVNGSTACTAGNGVCPTVAPCSIDGLGNFVCPGTEWLDGGLFQLHERTSGLYPDLQGIDISLAGQPNIQILENGSGCLEFVVGAGSVVTTAKGATWCMSTGNWAFSDLGFGTGTLTTDLQVGFSNTKNRGTILLDGGSPTQAVFSGAVCTCTDITNINAVQCRLSGSTLIPQGTTGDTIAYHCL